jgi:hypothetical protein
MEASVSLPRPPFVSPAAVAAPPEQPQRDAGTTEDEREAGEERRNAEYREKSVETRIGDKAGNEAVQAVTANTIGGAPEYDKRSA